jgi:hypothetical protein
MTNELMVRLPCDDVNHRFGFSVVLEQQAPAAVHLYSRLADFVKLLGEAADEWAAKNNKAGGVILPWTDEPVVPPTVRFNQTKNASIVQELELFISSELWNFVSESHCVQEKPGKPAHIDGWKRAWKASNGLILAMHKTFSWEFCKAGTKDTSPMLYVPVEAKHKRVTVPDFGDYTMLHDALKEAAEEIRKMRRQVNLDGMTTN